MTHPTIPQILVETLYKNAVSQIQPILSFISLSRLGLKTWSQQLKILTGLGLLHELKLGTLTFVQLHHVWPYHSDERWSL